MTTSVRSILAAGFYLAAALFALRVVLPAPARLAAYPADVPPAWRGITMADQKLVVAVVTAHARAVLHAPSTLLDGPQCYPLRHALMLGQHEFGQGLLGVVPYALSGDPVLTYNAVAAISLALAGLAMHFLVRGYTGSTAAALVAGTIFAVHPARVGDLVHMSAIANHWTVFTLLALHRFFRRPTWPAAAAVAVASSLQTLESIYPLVPHAILIAIVSLAGLWRHRRAWRALVPKLAAAGLVNVAAAAAVLGPYLVFKETWGALGGRRQLLYRAGDFAPGGPAYAGTVALALAALALLARRDREPGAAPPRAALVIAGLVVAWSASQGLHLPGTGLEIPSLFALLGSVVPGFDAVRRGGVVVSGWYLVASVLAGLGAAALGRRRGAAARIAITAVLLAAACAEIFVPGLAQRAFGRTVTLQAYVVRPPDAFLAMYPHMRPGAVLDVPYELGPGRFFRMADFVLAGAYHGHRVAACYNSFLTALQDDVSRYAARVLADPGAAGALAALGMTNVVVHRTLPGGDGMLPSTAAAIHLEALADAGTEALYALPAPPPTTGDRAALTLRATLPAASPDHLDLVFANPGARTYRHPDPIEPTPLVIRWFGVSGELLGTVVKRVLRPAVLVPDDEIHRRIDVPPGVAAAARVTIADPLTPETPLATLVPGHRG
ncbi:MAG: hypothetical protein B6D46_06960 [Polyangiaceae bacterium UTPRO1]|jgi:energy-converting hydrogenase Eha subunit B|nr:hypothetical protein [Myxococcales bacterium]OQY67766.1 MAG: hypothetical protein B6D46_06960 [Polyangiaceae bacterium UTPRO1]